MAGRKAAVRTKAPARPRSPRRVAYLGPEGTYSHSAVQARFGEAVEGLPLASIEDVVQAVQERRADIGVVPAESSSEGAANITLDSLKRASPANCGGPA